MICIACENHYTKLSKSHVIPNFFRKRMTGVNDDGTVKFAFTWINRKDLPNQDLPKPNLMCSVCDSRLGATVERNIPSLLMPSDVNKWSEWKKLPIRSHHLMDIFNTPLWVGIYDYPLMEQNLLERFALSVAWRALHDISREGRSLSSSFLSSQRGQLCNKLAREYIFDSKLGADIQPASLYFLGPKSAKIMSGNENEMPFAWAELGESGEIFGVGVVIGFWIILWPLFDLSAADYFQKMEKLENLCFIHWVGKIKSELDPEWLNA